MIAEVVYVLSSKQVYSLSRDEIKEMLYPVLSLQGLKLAYRKTYLRALDLYIGHSIDFEDALTVAHIERMKIAGLISYDRDFDRIKSIDRQEP